VTTAAVAVVSLAVALVATPLAILVARRTGIMDHPGTLKPQAVAIPYLGGVGVFAGLAVGVLNGRPSVLVPLAAGLVLGVADDRFEIPPLSRLAGELGIGAAVVVTCPVHVTGYGAVLLLVPITVLLINGVNLLDGLDMLAGGVVAVAAVGFAVILHEPGRSMAVALGAALAGFLVFNRPPARIYLGDGGSYLLGTALAVLLAGAWGPHVALSIGTAALALVAIPVAEVAFAVIRRLRARRSLMAGDRGHPYDRLVTRGWPRVLASAAYIGAELLLTVAAVFAFHRSSLRVAVIVDVLAAIVLIAAAAGTGALSPDQEAHT
jgi:UDP-GlcNAc:undecaprenyl-phosphate/decaprenyl-phosphate GlcNAc-1-phosphate transferase